MRTLIKSIFTFALLLSFASAQAKAVDAQRRISVLRVLPYSKETSVLIQSGSKWICETELSPRVPVLRALPLSLRDVVKLEQRKTKLDQAKCKDQIHLSDTAIGDRVVLVCADDPGAETLLNSIGEDCGRH